MRVEVGQSVAPARRARAARPAVDSASQSDGDPGVGDRADRGMAAGEEVVRAADHDRAGRAGVPVNRRTVTRHLSRLDLGRRQFLDPGGDSNRTPGRIIARWPGHMVHLDVKKSAGSPTAAAGASTAATAQSTGPRTGPRPLVPEPGTSTCTQRSTGSPGWPTPNRCRTRKVPPPPRSWPGPRSGSPPTASSTSTASSPTTAPATARPTSRGIVGIRTRHQKTRPFTARHNARLSATSGSSPRSCCTPANTAAKTTDRPP